MLPFFVYGTLRPGEPNYARLLAGRTASELPATLAGGALFTEGPYPFLVTAPDLARPDELVRGELIAVPAEIYQPVLAQLDELEGYEAGGADNLYERIAIEVDAADGPRQAWVYVAGTAALARIRAGGMRRIPGGEWPGPPAQM